MTKLKNLKELKELAIGITHSMPVYFPQYHLQEVIQPIDDATLEKGFDINNGIIAFVSNNIKYVIPYMDPIMEILQKEGFSYKSMNVPFSNWDFPMEYKERWKALKEMAQQA